MGAAVPDCAFRHGRRRGGARLGWLVIALLGAAFPGSAASESALSKLMALSEDQRSTQTDTPLGRDVRQLALNIVAALEARDAERLRAFYSEDPRDVFFGANGIVARGSDKFIGAQSVILNNFDRVEIQLENIDIADFNPMAVLTAEGTATAEIGGIAEDASFRWTLVARRFPDGKWRVVHEHYSS